MSFREELLNNYTRMKMLTNTKLSYYDGFGYIVDSYNNIILKIILDSEFKRGKIIIPDGFDILDPKSFMFFESKYKRIKDIDLGSISKLESFSLSCLFVKNIYANNVKIIDSFVFDECKILENIYLPNLEVLRYDSFDLTTLNKLRFIQLGPYQLSGRENIISFLGQKIEQSKSDGTYMINLK